MAAKAKKAATPASESSASSRSTSPESAQNKAKSDAEESSSSESESSNERSESSSESDSDSSSDEKYKQESNGKKTEKPSARVSFQAPQPYKPPSGFKSVKKQSPPSASTASLLSDLSGKQIYHITAPAFLPLDTVKELSLSKVMQGEPILKHKGAQYGIPVDSMDQNDTGEKTLLLYDPKTQTYASTAVRHIQSYHIQQMVNLPERSETDDKVLEAAKKLVKPPRKQPKNLKMRFRPLGSGEAPPETLGSGSEGEGEEPTFKIPKGAEKEERKRKHHHTEADNSQAGVPRKKSKKHSESGEKAEGKEKEKSKKSSKSKEEKKRKKSDKSA
ncbi:DNA-directed RNA polymerase I subunit RPA34.5-domain-containing protein [Aspergillus floccosus]